MKLRFFKNLALIFAGLSLLILCLFSCKKDFINPDIDNKVLPELPEYDQRAMEIVGKIKHFKSQIVKCKTEKLECNMQIDSALWNMEALINATYTFPERYYNETVKQELQFSVDVDENGNIPINVVASLYEDVTNSVRDAYANDGIADDKSLMTVVFERGDTCEGKALFDVSVISGRGCDNQKNNAGDASPFSPGDCWYFGELGGTCDDPSVICDAAEVLEDTINYMYAATLVPVPGFRYINSSLKRVTLNGSEYIRDDGTSYIFNSNYTEDQSLYFDYDILNRYFNGELKVLLQLQPEVMLMNGEIDHNTVFVQVDIRGLYESGVAYHQNVITYGDRMLVPITVIGPAVDMLK